MQSTFEEDWIMRQIKLLVTAIAKIAFGRDAVLYEMREAAGQSETDKLHLYLLRLIDDGKINEAEDLLFDALNPGDKDTLLLAVDFYQKLNALRDEELERRNFSRQEVYDGLLEIQRLYGLNFT